MYNWLLPIHLFNGFKRSLHWKSRCKGILIDSNLYHEHLNRYFVFDQLSCVKHACTSNMVLRASNLCNIGYANECCSYYHQCNNKVFLHDFVARVDATVHSLCNWQRNNIVQHFCLFVVPLSCVMYNVWAVDSCSRLCVKRRTHLNLLVNAYKWTAVVNWIIKFYQHFYKQQMTLNMVVNL